MRASWAAVNDRHEHGGRGTDIKLGGNVRVQVMEAIAADPDGDPEKIRERFEH